jgi:hypothetical protein
MKQGVGPPEQKLKSKLAVLKDFPESNVNKAIKSKQAYQDCGFRTKARVTTVETKGKRSDLWGKQRACMRWLDVKWDEKGQPLNYTGSAYANNYCKKGQGRAGVSWCWTTKYQKEGNNKVANYWGRCAADPTPAGKAQCQKQLKDAYRPNSYSAADEKYYKGLTRSREARIYKWYKRFQEKRDNLQKWTRIFEKTLDIPQAKRPQDWFSLEYQNACAGKERCEMNVVVAE